MLFDSVLSHVASLCPGKSFRVSAGKAPCPPSQGAPCSAHNAQLGCSESSLWGTLANVWVLPRQHGKWEQLTEYKFSTFLFLPRQYHWIPFMWPFPIVHLIEIISASTWIWAVKLMEGQRNKGRGFKKLLSNLQCVFCVSSQVHTFSSWRTWTSVRYLSATPPESRKIFKGIICFSAFGFCWVYVYHLE